MTFVLFTMPDCHWCKKAKELLTERDEKYVEFDITQHPILREFLVANNLTTVPQVFNDGLLIGGYVDLEQEIYFSDGEDL